MNHLERIDSLAPRRGVNRTTAIAIVSALAVFSMFIFFGLANAMLPDRGPAAGLGDGDTEEPVGRVPSLESPDGTEAVAARASNDEQVISTTNEPSTDEDVSDDAAVEERDLRTPRSTRGQGRSAPRNDSSSRGSTTSTDGDTNPRRVETCDSSDPLCGVDFGGPLDA